MFQIKRKVSNPTSEEISSIVKEAFEIIRKEGIKIFLKKASSYTKNPFLFYYTSVKVRNINKKSLNLNDLVKFCFYNCGGLIKPLQIQEEILELLRILDKIKPKIIVEIGTAGGGTLFLFSHIASEDATIISIDLPRGKFGGGYSKWKIPLYKSFRLPKQQLYLIRADSHSQETLKKVNDILNGKKIDFLFIDGDHTYEGVKRDFEIYIHLVKESGIIVFHDIVVHPPEIGCEVNKFWKELKDNYTNKEIVKDWKQGECGIGMLKVGK